MPIELNAELKPVFEACITVSKSDDRQFCYKWLKLAGNTFHHSKLTQLVKLGLLKVDYNGTDNRESHGKAWYSVA